MNNHVKIILLLLVISTVYFPQEEAEIEKKRTQLSSIRTEIEKLENELSDHTEKEKKSYETFENYNRQLHLLNKVVSTLRGEKKARQSEINRLNRKIKILENKIKILKKNYEKYVVAIYMRGQLNEIESIIDAESIRQALVRFQYLQKFSERRKVDLEDLKVNKEKLITARSELEEEKRKNLILVAEKESEEENLVKKLNERSNILSSIREDKKELQKLIDVKKQSQEQIKSLIAKLVEEAERKRREEELRRQQLLASKDGSIVNESDLINSAGNEYPLIIADFSSFTELKGEMLWPLFNGNIVRKFGQNKNTELNTVTLNYGVDISSNNDLNVRCVAEGLISAIDWLPGYGSVIIVSHKEDYRTVYSHLSEIFVEEGEKVKTGKIIAKIGESVDGNVLHFEIWNSRENQNPELWLAKK
ncbi:murein hydrolase activator EnvC family protein [Bacteroidota bacterium]